MKDKRKAAAQVDETESYLRDTPKPQSPSTAGLTSDDHPDADLTVESRSAVPPSAGPWPEFPGYTIHREIARGGMGRVLSARDLSLERDVAIKVLLATADPTAAARFVTESKITARLPHPGVPPVYAHGTLEDHSPYLVMKRVDGQTLADLLKQRRSVSDDLAKWLSVFEQVCQAVGFAHSRGILHRDVKPSNVMVGAFGEVHVMDWGLAREISRDGEGTTGTHPSRTSSADAASAPPTPDLTAAGTIMGTPAYMSPEQARGEQVDARADVFALGGIVSVILTGSPAFVGNSSIEIVQRAASGDLDETFARLDACDADTELVTLAKQCMSAERALRPANGQAVAQTVAAYRANVDRRLREAEAERAATTARMLEQRKRRRVQMIAACIIISLLMFGGAAVSSQWWRAEDALTQLIAQQAETRQRVDELTASQERNVAQLEKVTNDLVGEWTERQASFSKAERQVIDGLLPMWEELAAARGDTREARELRAKGHFRAGFLLSRLGNLDKAAGRIRQALTLYDELASELPDEPKYRHGAAVARFNLGRLAGKSGQDEQAEREYSSARQHFDVLTQEHPQELAYRQGLATTHINLAVLAEDRHEAPRAEAHYAMAIELFESLSAAEPDEFAYQQGIANCFNNLGVQRRALGKLREAEQQFSMALEHGKETQRRSTMHFVRIAVPKTKSHGDQERVSRRQRTNRTSRFELLEPRLALSTFTVVNSDNAGTGGQSRPLAGPVSEPGWLIPRGADGDRGDIFGGATGLPVLFRPSLAVRSGDNVTAQVKGSVNELSRRTGIG